MLIGIKANEKAIREYLDKNKGHDLFTVRSKQEIKESLESLFKPIELIEYPINNPKDYKRMPKIPGFPKICQSAPTPFWR